MFQINKEDKSIYVTRGDVVTFSVSAETEKGTYTYHKGDTVRFTVYGKKNAKEILLRKDFLVSEETEKVDIVLTESDTKIGDVISKPTDYWYEIELNPHTTPQTIIGYDDDGAKVFRLFPEGDESATVDPEDIPIIDGYLSTESERPVANSVITLKFAELTELIAEISRKITSKDIIPITQEAYDDLLAKGTWQEDTVYLITNPDGSEGGKADLEEIIRLVEEANRNSQNAISIANTASNTANSKADTFTYTVSVPYTVWTEDAVNGGYICTVAVAGILSTDNPFADVVLGIDRDANALYLDSWAKVERIVTNDNSITLYASGVPDTTFTIQLKVVR